MTYIYIYNIYIVLFAHIIVTKVFMHSMQKLIIFYIPTRGFSFSSNFIECDVISDDTGISKRHSLLTVIDLRIRLRRIITVLLITPQHFRKGTSTWLDGELFQTNKYFWKEIQELKIYIRWVEENFIRRG